MYVVVQYRYLVVGSELGSGPARNSFLTVGGRRCTLCVGGRRRRRSLRVGGRRRTRRRLNLVLDVCQELLVPTRTAVMVIMFVVARRLDLPGRSIEHSLFTRFRGVPLIGEGLLK